MNITIQEHRHLRILNTKASNDLWVINIIVLILLKFQKILFVYPVLVLIINMQTTRFFYSTVIK